jgi:hypothetical protein
MSQHNGSWIGGGFTANVFYQGYCINFTFDATSQLPITKTKPGTAKYAAFATQCHDCPNDATTPHFLNAKLNSNLSAIQKKLLLAHKKCNHVAFDRIKGWAVQGKFGLGPVQIVNSVLPISSHITMKAPSMTKMLSNRQEIPSLSIK